MHDPSMAHITSTNGSNQNVSVDLTGPSPLFNGAVVLTAIDYFSRYPFMFTLKSDTSKEIIVCLWQVFSQFCLPEAIILDNDTPFISAEFTGFLT